MPRFIWKWLITGCTILMIPHLISGVTVNGLGTALAVAAVLGLLNACMRPLLVIITLPLTILSLGFFILIINAFLFKVTASLVEGFQVASFGDAFLASLTVSLVSWISNLSMSRDGGGVRFVVQNKEAQSMKSRRVVDLNADADGKWK